MFNPEMMRMAQEMMSKMSPEQVLRGYLSGAG